jgi:hypothetical protein
LPLRDQDLRAFCQAFLAHSAGAGGLRLVAADATLLGTQVTVYADALAA